MATVASGASGLSTRLRRGNAFIVRQFELTTTKYTTKTKVRVRFKGGFSCFPLLGFCVFRFFRGCEITRAVLAGRFACVLRFPSAGE